MGLTYEECDQLFRQGEFARLLTLSGRSVNTATSFEPRIRVVLAQALALAGDREAGRKLAEFDASGTDAPATRSQAEATLGLVTWRNGEMDSKLHHFHAAVRFAHESPNT